MKPTMNVTPLQWAIGTLGVILFGVSQLHSFDVHSILNVVGGVLFGGALGVNITGDGQVKLKDLPKEVQDLLRGG